MPPVPSSPPSSGVRRHHTISASSRSARQGAREIISEETDQQHWDEDEVVDQDWVVQGVLGAVGEKTSLHRQSSLPARYPRSKCFVGWPSNLTDQEILSLYHAGYFQFLANNYD